MTQLSWKRLDDLVGEDHRVDTTGSWPESAQGWPDQVERERWDAALRTVADRLRAERGLTDPWSLTVDFGSLWAHYGDRRLTVAGRNPEVTSAEELFEDLDSWAAFDRQGGPGRRLDRDREAMETFRAQLPGWQQLWEQAAPRVFRDVAAAAGRDVPWRVFIRSTETGWHVPRRAGGLHGIEVAEFAPGEVSSHERELDFPLITLELPHTWLTLGAPTDPDDGEGTVAELAGEVQDEIIEEVHGAWPECLAHAHPMVAGQDADGLAVWSCPDGPVSVPIGDWGAAWSASRPTT